jgi:NitT/TauT family transport system substrate-binding protein
MRKVVLTLTLIIGVGLIASGCATQAPQQDMSLKVAVLPILDTLPFYVAQQNGYFTAEGIEVELVPVKSPTERDALMQAGEVDGMLTDLPGVGVFNRDEPQVKVIAMARKAYPNAPLFRLLGAPGSGVNTVQDVIGVKIAVSQNTVIEYITQRMLELSGLSQDQMRFEEITAIPIRFEQLMAGQIPAATLPDPMASGALAGGASLIVGDDHFAQYSQSVLVFSVKAIDTKAGTLRSFLAAWDKAVGELNNNAEAYRDLLIEQGRVPESVQGSFDMPPYPVDEITSQEQWADIVDWLLEKDLISREIPYNEAVDTRFVP